MELREEKRSNTRGMKKSQDLEKIGDTQKSNLDSRKLRARIT
jgi:hypothetical protein